jgi:hypothetical protein
MWSCVEDDQIPLASGIDVAFAMAQQAGNLGVCRKTLPRGAFPLSKTHVVLERGLIRWLQLAGRP